MIMTVNKLREYITTDKTDSVLEDMLQALELLIRKHTNNNFQKRAYRKVTDIIGGLFVCDELVPFKVGDTIQVSESALNEGLYTVKTIDNAVFTVNEDVVDESNLLVTKIEYPKDVQMGVVNMIKWDLENRSKVGIQSETISRHSVTYFNMDGDNTSLGYPKSLIGFLKPYMRARF